MTTVSTFSSPVLYDKIAQELNTELNSLGYFDTMYPVCFLHEEEDQTLPVVYVNNGSKINLRALPDSTGALSFFIITGDIPEIEETELAVPMAFIAWMNLQKVTPAKQYDYTAEIVKAVWNVLDAYGCYDMSINVTDPLAEFTMLESKAINMRPYSAFRISFTKNIHICST